MAIFSTHTDVSPICGYISFPPSCLTYKHADWVVVFPQLRYLSLQQILALLRQGCSSLSSQRFRHLLQYYLPNPQQGPLQVSFPVAPETGIRPTISILHQTYIVSQAYASMHRN